MLRLRRYERISVRIGDFAPTGAGWPKISGRRGGPHQPNRLNDLLYGIKIWTDLTFVLSQSTRLTDRQTDTFRIASPRWHSMQHGKNYVLLPKRRWPPNSYRYLPSGNEPACPNSSSEDHDVCATTHKKTRTCENVSTPLFIEPTSLTDAEINQCIYILRSYTFY